jgi:hypothetical protein
LRVVRVAFHQVADVESVGLEWDCVSAVEEVPLSVALSSVVGLKVEIVFKIRHFVHLLQVAGLESGFKLQSQVVGLQFVVGLQCVVVAILFFGACFRGVLFLLLTVLQSFVRHWGLVLNEQRHKLDGLRVVNVGLVSVKRGASRSGVVNNLEATLAAVKVVAHVLFDNRLRAFDS